MKDLAKKYDSAAKQSHADSVEDQLARIKAGLGQ
jgi:hypothetical protein